MMVGTTSTVAGTPVDTSQSAKLLKKQMLNAFLTSCLSPSLWARRFIFTQVVKPAFIALIGESAFNQQADYLYRKFIDGLNAVKPETTQRPYNRQKVERFINGITNFCTYFIYSHATHRLLTTVEPGAFVNNLMQQTLNRYGIYGYLALLAAPLTVLTVAKGGEVVEATKEAYVAEHPEAKNKYKLTIFVSALFEAAHEFCTIMNGHDVEAIDAIYAKNPQLQDCWVTQSVDTLASNVISGVTNTAKRALSWMWPTRRGTPAATAATPTLLAPALPTATVALPPPPTA